MDAPATKRHRLLAGLALYLLLLGASHLTQLVRRPAESPDLPALEVPQTNDTGAIRGTHQRIAYRRWAAESPGSGVFPVILLHGSPGNSSNFNRLGPALASRGHDVYALDLPGFGQSTPSVPSYSILAHAYAVRLCMDELGIDRAHLVAWSQSGGVVLHLADLDPDRVATLTLMGAIGDQRAEGSGSYHFEHAKYAFGYATLVLGAELVPHFGALGSHAQRRAFIRNFYDSDQRPLRGIMRSLDIPTLILHGDDDFLTPEWGARLHHQHLRYSKLVILDASHFLPILQADEAAARMDHFFAHNAAPTDATRPAFYRERIDLSPPAETLGARLDGYVTRALPFIPWWVVPLLLAALAFRRPEPAAALAGFLVAMVWADAGAACAALLLGLVARSLLPRREAGSARPVSALRPWKADCERRPVALGLASRLQPWRRDRAMRAARATGTRRLRFLLGMLAGCALWTGASFAAALIVCAAARAALGDALPPFALMLGAALIAAHTVVYLLTWTGRQRLKAFLTRAVKHEYWPPWAYYAPLVPWLAWHGLRNGGGMVFTRVNPAIGAGGGVVGESKIAILNALAPLGGGVLRAVFIDTGEPADRLAKLKGAMADGRLPADYPIVLKPNAGQRGYAVRIARADDQALEYLRAMPRPVVAQTYHPGPIELGVMWVRHPDGARDEAGRRGRVFSLTHKQLPDLVGDGRRTIERLIYSHRRFRCQADVFLERFADRRLDVLAEGETLRLTTVGNHSKGAIFLDAAEHITPELEAWIDRAAGAFCAPLPEGIALPEGDNGLDFGRFDIRARTIEDVRAARDLAIIELNGTAAESTNIFDPVKPLWWSWGVLLRHWALLYKLGGRRKRMGVPAMGPLQLLKAWREFDADRPDIMTGL